MYLSLRTLVDGNNAAGIDAHQANQTDAADRQKADDANHSSAQNDGMEGKESAAEIKREWQQQQVGGQHVIKSIANNDVNALNGYLNILFLNFSRPRIIMPTPNSKMTAQRKYRSRKKN